MQTTCERTERVHRVARTGNVKKVDTHMGTESTASIIDYLRSLAPEFFTAATRGASEAQILRLEQRMSDGHAMGE